MKRMSKVLAGLVVVALAATVAPAGAANTMLRGGRDRALLTLSYPDSEASYHINVAAWSTAYYGGIPPREQGALGDVVVCFGFHTGNGNRVEGCGSDVSPTFDSLRTMTFEDDVELTFIDHDDVVTSETVAVSISLTGTGPLYPGVGASTNPGPGAELDVSLWRRATITGTISSPRLGVVDLSTGRAVLGRDSCLGLMAGPDDVEACRY